MSFFLACGRARTPGFCFNKNVAGFGVASEAKESALAFSFEQAEEWNKVERYLSRLVKCIAVLTLNTSSR